MVVEEVVQDVEDAGLRDEVLQVLGLVAVSERVHRREKDGLHLVVPQLIGRLLRCDQHLCRGREGSGQVTAVGLGRLLGN